MRRLARLFWNSDAQRPRALWRLVLQTFLLVACTLAAGVAAALLALPFGVGPGFGVGGGPGGGAPAQQQGGTGVFSAVIALVSAALSMAGAARFLDRRPFAGFGFHTDRRWWGDLGFGLALGPVLMGSVFLAGWALGWVEVTGTLQPASAGGSFARSLGAALLAFVCVGIYEEMISRGYHLLNVAEGLEGVLGPRAALAAGCAVSSAVFGGLHYGNPNATLLSTVCLVGAGLSLGLAYVATGELGLPIGLHISWNVAQGNVFGFPVSGTDAGASLLATRVTAAGPDWWTGGAFGPEAGLSGLLAILLEAAAVLAWAHYWRGSARPRLALARSPGARTDTAPGATNVADAEVADAESA